MGARRRGDYTCSFGCSVEAAFDVISGKWKGVVLFHLSEGTPRFNELRRRVPAVTQRMLTRQLRELEDDGVIHREVYPEVPPRVEYSLTDYGRTLMPVIASLGQWGDAHAAELTARRLSMRDEELTLTS